ncbi:22755_t:CDS:2 [Cetraspora pellucida]|uniref:22755_t:CDS:1 n=1 Tax=Cetraspora pellucida TaxID=1433469 RepID=A0A9N9DQM6_9GLOM|nr:22755_t:CDS:2 [Cetraspora pellucida]
MYYYLAVIIAFASYFLYKCYIYPLYLSPLRKIPGPPSENIILGHYATFLKGDHGIAFSHLTKQYGGIVRYHSLLNETHILITDPKLVQMIMISRAYEFPRHRFFIAGFRDIVGESVIVAEGDSHKRQRKMMSPSFALANIKEMAPTFVQAGHNLKDIWMKEIGDKEEERITITSIISKITLDVIGDVGFDYKFNSTTTESELAKAYKFLTSRNISQLYLALSSLLPFIRKLPIYDHEEYHDSLKIVSSVSEKLVVEHKNTSFQGTDILSLLTKANNNLPIDEQLTHQELIGQVMTLLIAGHETTSTALSWALYFLAKNPDMQDRLRKEILDIFPDRDCHPTFDQIEHLKYLECVFKEVLRMNPPVPGLVRINAKDEVLNGYFIPKKTPLVVPITVIHRDPSIWGHDAEHFNPSRWLDSEIKSKITNCNFMPFSAGPRSCLGMKMAYLEFKSILAVIIRNFEFKLVEGFTFKQIFNGVIKPYPGIDLMVSKLFFKITYIVNSLHEETSTSDEFAPLSLDNTNESQKKISSTHNRAPVRDYLLPTSDGGKRCKLCEQTFGNLTVISTINRHFQNFHPSEFIKIKQRRFRRFDPYGPNEKFKVDILNNKLLRWVVVD